MNQEQWARDGVNPRECGVTGLMRKVVQKEVSAQ